MRGPSPLPYMDAEAKARALAGGKQNSLQSEETPTTMTTRNGSQRRMAGEAMLARGMDMGEMGKFASNSFGQGYLQAWTQRAQNGFMAVDEKPSGGQA